MRTLGRGMSDAARAADVEQSDREYATQRRRAAPDVAAIMAYEQGDLDDADTVRLFQSLVDSGLAWKLQGHYGRTAAAMIKAGAITVPDLNASNDV